MSKRPECANQQNKVAATISRSTVVQTLLVPCKYIKVVPLQKEVWELEWHMGVTASYRSMVVVIAEHAGVDCL